MSLNHTHKRGQDGKFLLYILTQFFKKMREEFHMWLEESEKSHCKGYGYKQGEGLSATFQSFCWMLSISGQRREKSHT